MNLRKNHLIAMLGVLIIAGIGALLGATVSTATTAMVAVIALLLLAVALVLFYCDKAMRTTATLLGTALFMVAEIVGSQQLVPYWVYLIIVAGATFGLCVYFYGYSNGRNDKKEEKSGGDNSGT